MVIELPARVLASELFPLLLHESQIIMKFNSFSCVNVYMQFSVEVNVALCS